MNGRGMGGVGNNCMEGWMDGRKGYRCFRCFRWSWGMIQFAGRLTGGLGVRFITDGIDGWMDGWEISLPQRRLRGVDG